MSKSISIVDLAMVGPFCDELYVLGQPSNVKVGKKINAEHFWDLVEECIRMYSDVYAEAK